MKNSFKELPLYETSIKKPYIKPPKNIDMYVAGASILYKIMLKLNVKTSKAFKRYARSYSVEVIDSKNPSVQLMISRPSFKDLL